MNKKNYLLLGGVIVVLAVVIIILVSMKQPGVAPKVENAPVTDKITNETPVTPEQLEQIPLSEEAIIKYGKSGLETKTVTAQEGERVFLTFSAADEKTHIFTFSPEAIAASNPLETVLVMFSKTEGDKSINFLSPGAGSYEYVIDNTEKGTLIIK